MSINVGINPEEMQFPITVEINCEQRVFTRLAAVDLRDKLTAEIERLENNFKALDPAPCNPPPPPLCLEDVFRMLDKKLDELTAERPNQPAELEDKQNDIHIK